MKDTITEKAHEVTLDRLVKRLEQQYPNDTIIKNLEYGPAHQRVGEMDVYRASRSGIGYIYEVKGTKHNAIRKATKQINRARRYFDNANLKGIYVHAKYGVKRV